MKHKYPKSLTKFSFKSIPFGKTKIKKYLKSKTIFLQKFFFVMKGERSIYLKHYIMYKLILTYKNQNF